MVDTLGLPTMFFTLSAADLQWPELPDPVDVEEAENSTARSRAVFENLARLTCLFVSACHEVYEHVLCGCSEGH